MSAIENRISIQAVFCLLCLLGLLGACAPAKSETRQTAAASPANASPQEGGVAEPGEAASQPDEASSSQSSSESLYLRLNQVGYLPGDTKIGLALANLDLSSAPFAVIAEGSDQPAFSSKVGRDRGVYASFQHLYELDFSALKQPGRYILKLNDVSSYPFEIGTTNYQALLPLSLEFFRVQRCGDNNPKDHEPCHLNDGIAADGDQEGNLVDVTGGWHDAGDYIKFAQTTGMVVNLMLNAYQRHPEVFKDTSMLEETRVGLDWMIKLWDPKNKILYYQVSDESDHEEWRMPEDDNGKPPRTVWACEPGFGGNVAGKVSAALALASVIWKDPATKGSDPVLADKYLTAAKEIYAFGRERPGAQSSHPEDFYGESSWDDDMALAAAELYRATDDARYLVHAKEFAKTAGAGGGLDWGNSNGLAHYEIARLDPTYKETAAGLLAEDLDAASEAYQSSPFGVAVPEYFWGSNESMAGLALEALWYQDLTGDAKYRSLALAQRDFILGANPWGYCFVSGAGTNYPRHPHHQVASITGEPLLGFWDEGAVPRQDFDDEEITEMGPSDPLVDFQTEEAVYHDDEEDYITNEPTISMNGVGLALAAWFAAGE